MILTHLVLFKFFDVNRSPAVSGLAVTSAGGNLTTAQELALSGLAGTSAGGTIVGEIALAVAGQAGTFGEGSLALEGGAGLSGAEATGAHGDMIDEIAIDVAGLSGSSGYGDIATEGGEPTVVEPVVEVGGGRRRQPIVFRFEFDGDEYYADSLDEAVTKIRRFRQKAVRRAPQEAKRIVHKFAIKTLPPPEIIAFDAPREIRLEIAAAQEAIYAAYRNAQRLLERLREEDDEEVLLLG